ncbi:MAG: VWA domain-containing protein [Pseudomonadales bacterium]|nr:VWA domain-containing protein [Pseudomonadales bacterium]
MPFSSIISIFRTCLFVVLVSTFSSFIYAEEPDHPDVRIVVDISGSMKKNDPNNLRIPAVNMLLGLLPDEATVGVWTFGRYVNMLVPHKPISDTWRAKARKNIPKINSVAQYTNIELALKKAGYDLVGDKKHSNTHVILLTDGQVDISKNKKINAASRKKIKQDLVKRYRDAGVKIHTVALSTNADLNLLNKISLTTGGISTVAHDAEQLMGTFLQVLDQAAPQDQLPITGNVFQIDSSVEEATILLFRESAEQSTRLTDPNGKVWQSSRPPKNTKWFENEKYDLITITNPMRGDWVIGSIEHPDNRVSIISDLKMRVEGLPLVILPGDPLNMEVFFLEKDHVLDDPQFLELIDITIQIDRNGAKLGAAKVTDFPLVDGKYRVKLRSLGKYASYAILIDADGKTFGRKFQHVFKIAPPPPEEPDDLFAEPVVEPAMDEVPELIAQPVTIVINSLGTDQDPEYQIQMDIVDPTIDTDSAQVVSMIITPLGTTFFGSVDTVSASAWVLKLPPDEVRSPGEYKIKFSFSGQQIGGKEFSYNPDSLIISHPDDWVDPSPGIVDEIGVEVMESDDPVEGVEEILIDTIEEEPLVDVVPVEVTEEVDQEEQSSWYENTWVIGGLILFFNLLVIGGGFLLYRKLSSPAAELEEPVPVAKESKHEPQPVKEETVPELTPEEEVTEASDVEEDSDLQDLLDAVGEELVSEDPVEEEVEEQIEEVATTEPDIAEEITKPEEVATPGEPQVEEKPIEDAVEETAEETEVESESTDGEKEPEASSGGVDDLEDIDALMAEFSAIDEAESESEPAAEPESAPAEEESSEQADDLEQEKPAKKELAPAEEQEDEFEIVGFDEDLSDDP